MSRCSLWTVTPKGYGFEIETLVNGPIQTNSYAANFETMSA